MKDYDYSQRGAYYITICTFNHRCNLGEVKDGKMLISQSGKVILESWNAIPLHFAHVALDSFVVMPNHIHGILMLLDDPAGTACRAPTEKPGINAQERMSNPISGSLPTIIGSFKAAVSKRINELRNTPGASFWQRGYYEHVIRNEIELNSKCEYILNNPFKWELDRNNPANW